LEKLKDKREKIKVTLSVAIKLGRFSAVSKKHRQQVRTKVDDLLSVLQQLYGPSQNFTFENFLEQDPNDTPILSTFPRFVVYFFPFHSLPDPSDPNNFVLQALPSSTHYHQLSLLLHPDKNSILGKYQGLLNDAFKLWDPILKNPAFQQEPIPPQDDEELEQYQAKGEEYKLLSQMFYEYSAAYNAATLLFMPTSGSLQGLYSTLTDAEEAGKLVHASLDDEDTGMWDLERGIDEAIEAAKVAEEFNKSKGRPRRESKGALEDEEDEEEEEEEEDEEEDEEEEKETEDEEEDVPQPPAKRTRLQRRKIRSSKYC
jgi:hypothetical protein